MREIRQSGSEGGAAANTVVPTPTHSDFIRKARLRGLGLRCASRVHRPLTSWPELQLMTNG